MTEPDGTVALWRITARTGAVNARRAGWRPEDFIGHTVKVEGNPARRKARQRWRAGVVTFRMERLSAWAGVPEYRNSSLELRKRTDGKAHRRFRLGIPSLIWSGVSN